MGIVREGEEGKGEEGRSGQIKGDVKWQGDWNEREKVRKREIEGKGKTELVVKRERWRGEKRGKAVEGIKERPMDRLDKDRWGRRRGEV